MYFLCVHIMSFIVCLLTIYSHYSFCPDYLDRIKGCPPTEPLGTIASKINGTLKGQKTAVKL